IVPFLPPCGPCVGRGRCRVGPVARAPSTTVSDVTSRSRVEGVTKTVPDEVERQRGHEQEYPWEEQHPPGVGEQLRVRRVGEHPSPRGGGLGDANAEERACCRE